eukprot:CAMPEP_0116881632 /NCGR_PEP_ID=MMETSP0463-20121206/13713_1 /TAXON_ID=181622 /ORGANISM="Strombidinopsis sp, Strain SopsisLIS2011" /LENGTH=54 /DNA_ID=CAMNT_0004533709 /DNA_START=283 /DNA_END=447 /DNA_ORIENTATION=-
MKLFYVFGVFAFFGLIIYVIMTQLMDEPVDLAKQKRQRVLEKREKKASSGKKNK